MVCTPHYNEDQQFYHCMSQTLAVIAKKVTVTHYNEWKIVNLSGKSSSVLDGDRSVSQLTSDK